MASALVQFRADEAEKIEAVQICERLGLNLPAYLRMCMSRLVQEQGVPFSMRLVDAENPGIAAMKRASQIAAERGISDMTLDEINAEIAEARKQ
ncbi:MAG: type II toxin-antitoxin system RelB/DinJ family antitoxin [Actinomycetaceae bacterium]|nr:type II toxin-antitoxin system RelB/DinJ family antitoxin [Actinomycetaceae bacterium]